MTPAEISKGLTNRYEQKIQKMKSIMEKVTRHQQD